MFLLWPKRGSRPWGTLKKRWVSMKIWDQQSIQFFLMFFVPGFISIKIYDLLIPGERRDFTKAIPEAISYSALNFAFLYPIWFFLPDHFQDRYPNIYPCFVFLALFLAPVVWPVLWVWISKKGFSSGFIRSPIPTSWDYIFGKREAYWIIVHLTDGRRVGGRYDSQSFSTSYPDEPQIYLEEVWKLDDEGAFVEKVKSSRGIVILGKDILSVEFFANGDEENE
ncbi:MAG: hypothetical protein HW380_573 [Magnetococcales bacterium]|nr:hypothetical protein [Magnetococcales bacterium]